MAFAGLAVSAVSSLMQFQAQKDAAKEEQLDANITAEQMEVATIQREADRKSRLARSLASQTASAGARGIAAFEGSPLSVLQADIEAEETATQRDIFQSQLETMTQRTRGAVARQAREQQASIGLISDFAKIAKTA